MKTNFKNPIGIIFVLLIDGVVLPVIWSLLFRGSGFSIAQVLTACVLAPFLYKLGVKLSIELNLDEADHFKIRWLKCARDVVIVVILNILFLTMIVLLKHRLQAQYSNVLSIFLGITFILFGFFVVSLLNLQYSRAGRYRYLMVVGLIYWLLSLLTIDFVTLYIFLAMWVFRGFLILVLVTAVWIATLKLFPPNQNVLEGS